MKKLILIMTLCLFFNVSCAGPALRFSSAAPQLGPPAIALAQHTDEIWVSAKGGVALKGSGAIE
jgi:hypothetical protein